MYRYFPYIRVLIKGEYMSNILVSDECDTIEVVGEDRHGDLFETHEEAVEAMRKAMEDMDLEGELSELDMVETQEFIEFG